MSRHKKLKNPISEYGEQKNLQEILEELALWVQNNGGGNKAEVGLVLPRPALDTFHNYFQPVNKTKLEGTMQKSRLYATGAVVYLFPDDTHKVERKDNGTAEIKKT